MAYSPAQTSHLRATPELTQRYLLTNSELAPPYAPLNSRINQAHPPPLHTPATEHKKSPGTLGQGKIRCSGRDRRRQSVLNRALRS